jgi:phosphorylcholine metabolism protein LicD
MGGNKESKEKLNKTLLYFIKLLNENNMNNWFIGYGTLLGIVRDDSCINNDDDVDILISNEYYDKLKKLLLDNNFLLETRWNTKNSPHILKTVNSKEYASIDFYICQINNKNFNDNWEKVIWSNCLDLIEYKWNNEILYLPNNYEEKLINRYGENWKTPQNNKGIIPRKKIL